MKSLAVTLHSIKGSIRVPLRVLCYGSTGVGGLGFRLRV